MKAHTLLFTRVTEPSTIAILSLSSSHATVEEAKQAVINVVTEWINTTDEGKDAWRGSCEDLNIGDLVNYRGWQRESLLKKEGITACSLSSHNFDNVIDYDLVLVNDDNLNREA